MYQKHSLIPVFVTMQSTKDESITDQVRRKLNFETIVIKKSTAKELISIMSEMTFSIGMRLHFLIFSANARIPAIGLSYDPKINSLLEYIGCESPIDSSEIHTDILIKKAEKLLSNKYELSDLLKEKTTLMNSYNKVDAQKTIDLLRK